VLGIESPVEAGSSGLLPVETFVGGHGSVTVEAAWTWGRGGTTEMVKQWRADLRVGAKGAAEVKRSRDPRGGGTEVVY
jgi:hypothetical protein